MKHHEGVRAKKFLGQHFLNDEKMSAAIVNSLVLPSDCREVLEIGPGTGVLTRHLLQRTDIHIRVVELDRESVLHLSQNYPELDIIEGDFLQLDLSKMYGGTFAIIGNFPYNISTQILFKVLELKDQVCVVTGMYQAEVAERIASGPGNRDYGILSVLLQPWYDMEILFEVPPSSFIPPPRVNSAVLRMTRTSLKSLKVDESWFKKVVKQAFSTRRKTLRNCLKPMLQGKEDIPYLNLRAEALSWQQFEELALKLQS